MLISEIGEFGLIQRFRESIKLDSSVIKGSGDDCAVLKFNKDKYMLFTCDMLVENVDFKHNEDPKLVGRKALAVSISDIAACAGIPRYAVISLAMPKDITVGYVDKLLEGILSLAKEYKLNLVGGDISKSRHLTVDVGMLGMVEKKYLCLRSGAKIGDIIFVTGELGGSILGKHLRFSPRLKEARYLVKNFKVNSMIDISDGLTQDLGHILEESKVGAIIHEELIPVSRQARNLVDVLYMGEDFELLFTVSASEAKKLYRKRLTSFRPIGEIVDKKYRLRLVDKKGREKIIESKGFQHF